MVRPAVASSRTTTASPSPRSRRPTSRPSATRSASCSSARRPEPVAPDTGPTRRGAGSADRRAARGPPPPGADPLLLDRAPGRLLRAPRLPRRQRPRPRRSAHPRSTRPYPEARRRRADQGPQPGGKRRLLRRDRDAAGGCRRCCAETSPRACRRRSRPRCCSTASGRCRRRPRR